MKAHPHWKHCGDFCPVSRKDPHYEKGELIRASAGDLILWDSRTFHGGIVGVGEGKERGSGTRKTLRRMSMAVCMMPKRMVEKRTHELRRRAFEKGIPLTHWPVEYVEAKWTESSKAYDQNKYRHVPIKLTEDQRRLLG